MSLQVWLPLNGNLNNQGLLAWQPTLDSGTTATYTNGKIGQALNTGAITMPAEITSQILNNKEYSYACWFCALGATGSTTERAMIFGNDGMSSLGGRQFSLFQYSTANNLHWSWQNYTGGTYSSAYGGILADVFPTGQWVHLAVVYNNPSVKIYLNGEVKYTGSWVSNADSFAYNTKLIWNSQYHKLNDIRLYNHALSTKEVENLSKGLVLHYKLDNNGLGNPNLALNSAKLNIGASKNNLYISYRGASTRQQRTDGFTEVKCTASWQGLSFWENQLNLPVGTKITYGFYIYCNGNSRAFSFYPMMFNSAGTRDTSTGIPISLDGGTYTTVNAKAFPATTTTIPEYHYVTFEWNQAAADIISNGGSMEFSIQVHGTWNSGDWACLYAPKIEIGEKPTPWSPNPTDLGINSNIIEDCSGYNRAATANAITWSSPSPRYSAAAHFNGNSSYIKVDDNLWMAQGSTALTVNIWAYMNDWTSWNGHRLYSCTEGGGFNIENTVTNSLTFPVCVYTNAGQTSTAYIDTSSRAAILKTDITSGWHMFTYVYETTGCSCYLDGELYQTKPYTSYGIYYNINGSRLFLGCEANGVNPSGPYFNGQESDFRIYATALSADDIKELYNTSAAIDKDGNIYAREFINTGIVSNYQINKRGQMIPVDQFIERDEKLASIEKNNDVLGGNFYEY